MAGTIYGWHRLRAMDGTILGWWLAPKIHGWHHLRKSMGGTKIYGWHKRRTWVAQTSHQTSGGWHHLRGGWQHLWMRGFDNWLSFHGWHQKYDLRAVDGTVYAWWMAPF